MSSKAASAVYPALAKREAEQAAKQAKLAQSVTKVVPSWGISHDPVWSEPRAAPPRDYSRVPHLRKISK